MKFFSKLLVCSTLVTLVGLTAYHAMQLRMPIEDAQHIVGMDCDGLSIELKTSGVVGVVDGLEQSFGFNVTQRLTLDANHDGVLRLNAAGDFTNKGETWSISDTYAISYESHWQGWKLGGSLTTSDFNTFNVVAGVGYKKTWSEGGFTITHSFSVEYKQANAFTSLGETNYSFKAAITLQF